MVPYVTWKNYTFTVTARCEMQKKAEIGKLKKKVLIYYFGSIINDHSLGGSQDVPDVLRTTIKCFSIFHMNKTHILESWRKKVNLLFWFIINDHSLRGPGRPETTFIYIKKK